MKIFNFFILLMLIITTLVSSGGVNAQSPTASEELSEQITDLKDKIASRVAELDLVDKKGILGTVESVKSNQINLVDINNNSLIIDVDELTEFESSKSGFGISDIEKDMTISTIGRYNKQSERLLARFIEEFKIPVFLSGVVNSIDEDESTIEITDYKNKKYRLNVENTTRTNEYSNEDIVRSGFSKITVGDSILVTGFNTEDEGQVDVTRILILKNSDQTASTEDN